MAWGKVPGEVVDVTPPEDVSEERIREIVRDELAVIAVQGFAAAKKLNEDA